MEKPVIRIKNWHEFQHYRDRKPPWIKLHRSILDDYEFHCLSDASKALAPCLWLLASEYHEGEIPMEVPMIGFRFHMSREKVEKCLQELKDKGFISYASIALAERKQSAIAEVETEVEREKEAEAEGGHPALSVEETQRQISLRREALHVKPRTNFERSAVVTADAINRVLAVPRKMDDRVHPRLPPADDGSNGVGLPRDAVRSKRSGT